MDHDAMEAEAMEEEPMYGENGAEEAASEAEGLSREARCAMIIHGAAALAGAAAAASPLPGADRVAIAPIQIGMVVALGREYGIDVSGTAVRAVIYTSLGSALGRSGAGLLLRLTPIAGNVVRAGTALTVTEAIGQMIHDRLKAGKGVL